MKFQKMDVMDAQKNLTFSRMEQSPNLVKTLSKKSAAISIIH